MAFDYRAFYADYYGIEIPHDFDIHHIDGNRKNNDISNLLMLPKRLHHKYHMGRGFLENVDTAISRENCMSGSWNRISTFCDTMRELRLWVCAKETMDAERGGVARGW